MALLINNDVAARVLKMPEAVASMEGAFRQLADGLAAFQPRTDFWSPKVVGGDFYRWGALIGMVGDPPTLALRVKSDVLSWEDKDGYLTEEKYNIRPGLYCGFVLLFDTTNGELIALLNDGVLQHVRVGATAGVGTKYLSRENSEALAILGSGGMARTHAEAICSVRPIKRIRVFSPTQANREAYAAEMTEKLGVPVEPCANLRRAIEGADIVSACTDSRKAVFTADMLNLVNPGVFLVRCNAEEFDEETFRRVDKVIVTTQEGFLDHIIGTEQERARRPQGESYRRRYRAEKFDCLSDVIAGRVSARRDQNESVFYYNQSAGIQFAAICRLVYEQARAKGLGMTIPVDWFTQDIRN